MALIPVNDGNLGVPLSVGAEEQLKSEGVRPHNPPSSHLTKLIDTCARQLWDYQKPLSNADRLFFAKLIYKMDLTTLEDSKQTTLIKVRQALEEYLADPKGYQARTVSKEHPSLQHSAESKELPASSLRVVGAVVDELGDKGGGALYAAASVTAVYSEHSFVETTTALTMASASLCLLKTMKDGAQYCYQKLQISKLQEQIAQKTEASQSPPSPAAGLKLQKEIRELKHELAQHQESLKKLQENALTDALTSTTFFSGTVVGMASNTSLATVASAAVSGIGFGAALVISSGMSIAEDIDTERAFFEENKQLIKLERAHPHQSPNVRQLTLRLLRLRRNQLNKHHQQDLEVRYLKNGLNFTIGALAIVEGIYPILIEAGVSISGTVIGATSLAFGVFVGTAILIGLLAAIHYYRRMNQGGVMPQILECQQRLLEHELALQRLSEPLLLLQEKERAQFEAAVTTCLELNAKIEKEKTELIRLKALHKVEFQTGARGIQVMEAIERDIDALNENNIKEIKAFFHDFFDMPDLALLPSIEEKRNYLKIRLREWITA